MFFIIYSLLYEADYVKSWSILERPDAGFVFFKPNKGRQIKSAELLQSTIAH